MFLPALESLPQLSKLAAALGGQSVATKPVVESSIVLPMGFYIVASNGERKRVDIDPNDTARVQSLSPTQIEDVIAVWIQFVQRFVASIRNADELQDKGHSLSEFEFWRAYERDCQALMERFEMPVVDILERQAPSIRTKLMATVTTLRTEHTVATMNVDHLTNVIKLIRRLEDSGDYDFMIARLPDLLVELRNMRTVSDYFGHDTNMERLLRKISNTFLAKVKEAAALTRLFAMSSANASHLAERCASFLRSWQSEYLQTRKLIETLAVRPFWEFNVTKLFGSVEYAARVCTDLSQVLGTTSQFERLFGQRLKAMVSDPEEVDNMLSKVSAWPD